ncbi:hypothetical protein OG607_40140 [Streptomyces sp. NBC_01537]|uniref:hypothetical protein n=1 Tax=Streptomyces sp. NBC_01537 TaxID=2903896 RepID=UPI00386D37EF
MTARNTGARAAEAVRVRAEGDVGEEALAYIRTKVGAIVTRQGLPAVTGEVRIAKASAHHTEHPWSAVAELQVGSVVVVAHAREATSEEVTDRLQDRLRRQVERVAHDGNAAARRAVTPPWRGGPATDGATSGIAGQADARPA